MPFPHEVYKTQRIVPIRFSRGVTGIPLLTFPDLDNRGWFRNAPGGNNAATNDHGFVVGVMQGDTVFVKVTREKVDDAAPLFVTSSATGTMTCGTMGTGLDPMTPKHDFFVQITGVSGGAGATPNIARVQIRHGSNSGPIIGELSVWVFARLDVNITPHNVTISGAGGGAGIASAANVATIMDTVKAIWRPCGVDFTVSAIQNDAVNFANAGVAAWQAEINTLLNTSFVPNTINAYFINQIFIAGSPGVLGLGFSRPNSVAFGTPNPGIILADQIPGFNRSADVHYLANDLAHEVGHFFTLEHVDRRNADNPRNDTWALRMLMHPVNTRFGNPAFRNDTGYGVDATDGAGYRGALVSMKDLTDSGNAAHHSTDAECTTARTGIASVAGPY
jgi:hypothetical protein